MFSARRVTLAVAAQLIFAFSHGAAAQDIPAALVSELHRWIDRATDLPPAAAPAVIVFAQQQDLEEPDELATLIGLRLRGLYDRDTGTITLVRPWSAQSPQDVAVLLHELVHHRQRGRHYYCEPAKEHAAYSLHRDWLAERGLPLDVNWIAVVLASSCAPRDIHP